MKLKIRHILLIILLIGYLLPILSALLMGRITYFHPLLIISTSNKEISNAEANKAQYMAIGHFDFSGAYSLFIRRYDAIDKNYVRPYYWFNIPGKIMGPTAYGP